MTLLLFIALPLVLARLQGVQVCGSAFSLPRRAPLAFIAAAVLGCTLWPLAYDLIILVPGPGHRDLRRQKSWPSSTRRYGVAHGSFPVPSAAGIAVAIAVVPAIGEEFFFRGYLLGGLRGRCRPGRRLALTAIMFGLFHASVGGIDCRGASRIEHAAGHCLGWVCWRTAAFSGNAAARVAQRPDAVAHFSCALQLGRVEGRSAALFAVHIGRRHDVIAVIAAAVLMIDWRRPNAIVSSEAKSATPATPSDAA